MDQSKLRNWVYEKWNTPRISCDWKELATRFLDNHLPTDISWKNILDYWCGNGQIWECLLQKWANVDFVDISTKMVNELKQRCASWEIWNVLNPENVIWNARVFQAESLKNIPAENERYDYIVVWSVFHHINPNNRKEFLDIFWKLLKKNWKLFVEWLDENDFRLKTPGFKAFVTWKPLYPINSLPWYINSEVFEIEDTQTFNTII